MERHQEEQLEQPVEQQDKMDIQDLGHMVTIATTEVYGHVLDKFSKKMEKYLSKDATEEERESFKKRLRDEQVDKMTDRITLLMNRALTDHNFLKNYNELMSNCKTASELRQDIDIANNHLQSFENDHSILKRDTDQAIDKVESLCELILEDLNTSTSND